MSRKKDSTGKNVAENRRARYDYALEEHFEAGIQLHGTEVKALRGGKSSIVESFAEVRGGECFLVNSYIPEYLEANRHNHETKRPRRLLLHGRELRKLAVAVGREGMTLVPLRIYFNEAGRAKVELALAKGKKNHDKRETEKTRDWDREKGRLLRAA